MEDLKAEELKENTLDILYPTLVQPCKTMPIHAFPKGKHWLFNFDTSTQKPSREVLWKDAAVFLVVRPSCKRGPKSTPESAAITIQFIIGQSVNFARLHMSADPFQLFSIGILIFGGQFCIASFDRGITPSPIHDMWTDPNIVIQVIRRLSCDLFPKELG
jgi:hypothetical protein